MVSAIIGLLMFIVSLFSPMVTLNKQTSLHFFKLHTIDGYLSIIGFVPFLLVILCVAALVFTILKKSCIVQILTGTIFWLSSCVFLRLVFISRDYSKVIGPELKNIHYLDLSYGWFFLFLGILLLFLATLSVKHIIQWAKNFISVDLRTLAIFRIMLGLVCFIDILRRIPYIDIFYSNYGVTPNHFMADISS